MDGFPRRLQVFGYLRYSLHISIDITKDLKGKRFFKKIDIFIIHNTDNFGWLPDKITRFGYLGHSLQKCMNITEDVKGKLYSLKFRPLL